MRASGDPYLQHCVETAVLLAMAGATSSVVAAGLLHDTMDDSFTSYDHISRTFGAGVADLVEGVSLVIVPRESVMIAFEISDDFPVNFVIKRSRNALYAIGFEIEST